MTSTFYILGKDRCPGEISIYMGARNRHVHPYRVLSNRTQHLVLFYCQWFIKMTLQVSSIFNLCNSFSEWFSTGRMILQHATFEAKEIPINYGSKIRNILLESGRAIMRTGWNMVADLRSSRLPWQRTTDVN